VITVVLDDDPTGTQAASNVSAVLDWSDPAVWATVGEGDHGVHVLTNSRAHDGDEARLLVASAAAAARAKFPSCRLMLRGDSTLRAHLWEEYEALVSVIAPGRQDVPLLLVPALPAAGRITVDGVHLLERDNERTPLGSTEYAQDGKLAYTHSDLNLWAEERSQGRLAARDAVLVPLDRLRQPDGVSAVTAAIAAAAQRGRPAAVIPDAETEVDLRTIAEGQRTAEEAGLPFVVRCSPALAAVVTGSTARAAANPPSGNDGVLVVCGSFVPTSTIQIGRLGESHPDAIVNASVAKLAAEASESEVERLAETARSLIDRRGLAVIVTDRHRDPALVDPTNQRQIARALAQVARHVNAGVIIAKGGITSAVTARDGLGARSARVVGPILPGVALWRLDVGTDYVVVPGNVGGPDLLVDLVSLISPSVRTLAQRTC